jgi:hypothetical protein
VTSINIRYTTPADQHMFAYSHSIVEAILTCPVWGLIRYAKGLYYPIQNRQLPLEAGGAMHEVFAAVRLWQLLRLQNLPDHFKFHGERLFNDEDHPTRFRDSWKVINTSPRDELLSFCFKVLNTGDYYDDPNDKTRTLANMEETIIKYVDEQMPRMDANPIWVADINDPIAPVGIEQVFDIIIEQGDRSIRYIGTIDGITCPEKYPGTAMVDENKTASRLDETWRKSYQVKSQPTGYIAVARLLTGLEVTKVRMIGIKIKQTRSNEDYYAFIEEREDFQLEDWVRSLFFADELNTRFGDDPLSAPQFTHSCSRYFRACAFIDLCSADPQDRQDILDGMVQAPLTPSQRAIKERLDASA